MVTNSMTTDGDVNLFFETNSVTEIQNLLKKTRNDIERKKEELRIMVGERYRDLIEAADTIADMQKSAESISANICTMEGLCESLQQRGLIGFKTRLGNKDSDFSGNPRSYPYRFSFATQVKLLVDVPEMLWSLNETNQFLSASQLLLLAQHTYTSIQLSPDANQLLLHFPVVSYQWSNIQQFKLNIARSCAQLVKSEVVNHEFVLDATAAMMLIEEIGVEEVFLKFLDLRRASLENVLVAKPSMVAKNQLEEFVTVLLSTFQLISKIFVGLVPEESCLLEKIMQTVATCEGVEKASFPIKHLHKSSLSLRFLPKSLTDFRPKIKTDIKTLSIEYIQQQVSSMTSSLFEGCSKAIEGLLSCVMNIKALALIRDDILDVQNKFTGESWNQVEEVFATLNILDPWKSIIGFKVLERAKKLIQNELNNIKKSLVRSIEELAEEIMNNNKVCIEEGDVGHFVWGEAAADLPEQLGWALASGRSSSRITNSRHAGLFYKTRGFTKKIQAVSKMLNDRLEVLLESVINYCPTTGDHSQSSPFSINSKLANISGDEDSLSLLSCLQDETLKCFKRCATEIEELAVLHNTSDDKEEEETAATDSNWKPLRPSTSSTILIVASRICCALTVSCTQLKMCSIASLLVDPDIAKRMSLGSPPSWQDLKSDLERSSDRLIIEFLRRLCHHLESHLSLALSNAIHKENETNDLLLFPKWEEITLEEENENGDLVKSSVLIPCDPSCLLSLSLIKLCHSVNHLSVHTLSRSALNALNFELSKSLLSTYEKVEPLVRLVNQATALQFIFDIKFLQAVIISRENKEIAGELNRLMKLLEERVDPFDLDVFLPHINTRVKHVSQRMQILVGVLTPREKQNITKASSVSLAGSNNTLILTPSLDIPRFANVPLPVKVHSSYRLHEEKSREGSPRDESASASVVSRGPTSLLSAMSSSWFGGGTS